MVKRKPIFINQKGIPEVIKESIDESLIQLASSTENGLMSADDKTKLNALKDPSISTDFNYLDFISSSKLIREVTSNSRIVKVDVVIENNFDSNASITIGDSLDNQRLADENLSDLSEGNSIYTIDNNYIYTTNTNIYIYFQNLPSTGSGTVVIYLD